MYHKVNKRASLELHLLSSSKSLVFYCTLTSFCLFFLQQSPHLSRRHDKCFANQASSWVWQVYPRAFFQKQLQDKSCRIKSIKNKIKWDFQKWPVMFSSMMLPGRGASEKYLPPQASSSRVTLVYSVYWPLSVENSPFPSLADQRTIRSLSWPTLRVSTVAQHTSSASMHPRHASLSVPAHAWDAWLHMQATDRAAWYWLPVWQLGAACHPYLCSIFSWFRCFRHFACFRHVPIPVQHAKNNFRDHCIRYP